MARRRFLLALLAAAALTTTPAYAAPIPDGAEWTEATITSGDGVTLLHADVLRPKGASGKVPVILSIGPYFNHTGQTGPTDAEYDPTATGPNTRFADMYTEGKIFQKGYAFVMVDLRGFGASTGCNDFGGPGEQADVKAAVEWAAAQPWSSGKVGMWGKSYDGWTEVMALGQKPKGLAAAVIQSPIIDGYRTLWQNGIHYGNGWYITPGLYSSIDATPNSPLEPLNFATGTAGTNPACYAANIAQQNATSDHDDPTGFWKARDMVPTASSSEVPVLWSHGFVDANTKPDNFMDIWSTLKGPHRAWFGQYPHVRPQDKDEKKRSVVGREGFIDEAMRWFDRYLKGDQSARVEDDPAVEVEDGGLQKYRAEAAWPPVDAARTALQLQPGDVVNQQGNDGDAAGGALVGGGATGNGLWSIGQPLPYDLHLAGVPKLTVKLAVTAPRTQLHAILYDVSEKGKATLVTRAGAAALVTDTEKTFDLYPQDWTFKAGHRIGLLMAESDDQWFAPEPYANVATSILEGSTLSLPFLKYARTSFLQSLPTDYEKQRVAPFDVAADALAKVAKLELPPAQVDAPAVVLPGTATKPRAPKKRFTIGLKQLGRRRLSSWGRAPSGATVTVQLRLGKRVVATRKVKAARDQFRVTFRVKRAGKYRAFASLRNAGATVRVRSRIARVR